MAAPQSRIGLISDTHGLLRPEALAWLAGCQRIIHGGDIGSPAILDELARLAPLTAVRGNNDAGPWAERLHDNAIVDLDGVRLIAIHNVADLHINLHALRVQVVVSGHSHKPRIEERDGIIFVNPGSAGPRRFKLPVAVGEVWVQGTTARARVIELAV